MKRTILLDGGMGREIKRLVPDFDPILWSATGLIKHPDIVRDLHKRFIEAGAEMITTNNYTVVPSILSPSGYMDQFDTLIERSGQLAQEAKRGHPAVSVAGSIPPLESTYRPDLVPAFDEAVAVYERIATGLNPYVDVFLCESMSSLAEAKSAIAAVQPFGKPIWVSFLLDDNQSGRILSGEWVTDIPGFLTDLKVDTLLFNCCEPDTITAALPLLNDSAMTLGGYANAFKKFDDHLDHMHGQLRQDNTDLSIEAYLDHVKQWLAAGAQIIGGCCGIGPTYIAAVSEWMIAYEPSHRLDRCEAD